MNPAHPGFSAPVAAPRRRPLTKTGAFTFDRGARLALTGLAAAVGVFYVGLFAFLLARGGGKALSLALFATPLGDIEGESRYRWILAIGTGVVLGLGTSATLAALPERLGAWAERVREVAFRHRAAIVLAVTAFVAVGLRHHLPFFLLRFPSETQAGGGVGPEIFNTLYFAVLSTLVTFPVGLGAAIYLARFAKSRRLVTGVRTALDALASLPSIVYGLFGFLVFVVQLKAGYSLVAGALVLGILNLPLVVGIAEESLRAVPHELEDGSLAVGASMVQTVFRVTVPYAWPGILSAVVLSIGRVFAESAPLIMTAGTTVSRTNAYSFDAMRGGETLAVHLWYVNSAGLSPDRADVSAGTAAVLVVLVFLTNMAAARLARFGGAAGTRTTKITK